MWLDLSLNNPTEPSDPNCIFCSTQVEDIGHLYFGCHWTKECLQRVNRWLNWTNTGENLEEIIKGIQRSKIGAFRKKVVLTCIGTLVYSIWNARNCYIWATELFSIEKMLGFVRIEVKNRVSVINCKKVDSRV